MYLRKLLRNSGTKSIIGDHSMIVERAHWGMVLIALAVIASAVYLTVNTGNELWMWLLALVVLDPPTLRCGMTEKCPQDLQRFPVGVDEQLQNIPNPPEQVSNRGGQEAEEAERDGEHIPSREGA